MPPRTNQIKAVAREAQIELWLATVQRALLEGLRIRNDAVAIVMEGRGSDTRGKFGLRAGKLWKLPLCGSSGKIKLQRQIFHCFHIAWKTLRKKQVRREFSTVPTASAAGFNLGRETGEQSRNLLREVAGTCLGKLMVNRERGWLPRKCKSQPARGKFFLDGPLS
jgi:hypothetical protein